MKPPFHLDPIDRRILDVLQRDAAVSSAALAETAGASAVSCWRRIKALEAAGLFRGAVRLLNPARIGRDLNVFCHVRLRSHGENIGTEFEAFVAGCPEIVECYAMTGEWDYMLRIVAREVGDYERFLMRTLHNHAAVATTSSHVALRQAKYTTALPI